MSNIDIDNPKHLGTMKVDLPLEEQPSGARQGVGSLPGPNAECGVAILPDERHPDRLQEDAGTSVILFLCAALSIIQKTAHFRPRNIHLVRVLGWVHSRERVPRRELLHFPRKELMAGLSVKATPALRVRYLRLLTVMSLL